MNAPGTEEAGYAEFTPKRRAAFLAALSNAHTVTRACKAAGLTRRNAYNHRESNPEFRKEWDEAKEAGGEFLEEEARRRATVGTLKPVFQRGEEIGHIREYSDTLLIFLMKGTMPDKYGDRQRVEHSGKDGEPLEFTIRIDNPMNAGVSE